MSLAYTRSFVDNGAGWQLALHRFVDSSAFRRDRAPVVMVPGFAMNSFALRYRPNGPSIARALAHAGFEVWCAELRQQGDSRCVGGLPPRTLADIGLSDLQVAFDAVIERTATRAHTVDAIGCSLGATYVFMQAAWGEDHRVGRIINLGGPLRWTATHRLLRLMARAPALWGLVGFRGTRGLARRALPLAARIPGFLHLYLHPAICDLSEPASLVQTVDDPIPSLNAEIARWIHRGDLVHEGRNLTHDVAALDLPLLTVVANADGIVPEATTCSAHNVMTRASRSLIYAGDHRTPMAHADLFISAPAAAQVFDPIIEWLLR